MLCCSNLTETNTQTNMRHGGYTCICHVEARLAQGVRCESQVRFDMRGLKKSRVERQHQHIRGSRDEQGCDILHCPSWLVRGY
jgi:hypothetical protein